ncbi:TIR domain-containing protein [Peribacillus frigoritolerans]|uniref:TIR domain-containing protein n=1 Tax=Peribacillus frigoritolerans TaxID=450367 RepID=UPI001F4F14FB|nr:TIR domain-containing protein [Peribacillus frigoritolerans]MCK2020518.1 toll/interleukin-1 receptor domain-containing protein [Peribacillus frigoritolerans]
MRVFLSWSGNLSHKAAIVFKEWLPLVIQSVDAYVSSEDIDKGKRWSTHIAKELEKCSYGIVCVTKENLSAPWVNFEAGALSKFVDDSYVSPFLLDLKKSEVNGPLLQFQLTAYEKEEVRKLIKSINKAAGDQGLEETRLYSVFEVFWPVLETKLNNVLLEGSTAQENNGSKVNQEIERNNPNEPILEELLELSRSQQKLLNSPNDLIPTNYFKSQIMDIFEEVTLMMRTSNDIQEIRQLTRSINRNIRELEESYKSFPGMKIMELNDEFKNAKSIGPLLIDIKEKQEKIFQESFYMFQEMELIINFIREKINQGQSNISRKAINPRRKPRIVEINEI